MLRKTVSAVLIIGLAFGNSESLSIGRNVPLEGEIQQSDMWRDDPGRQNPNSEEPTVPPKTQSLLPNPNGPLYGFPYDLSATFSRMLPFTISGVCEVLNSK